MDSVTGRDTGRTLQLCLSWGCQEPCQVSTCVPSYHPIIFPWQNQVGPSPNPALGLHWRKSQEHQQKEKHSAFKRLLCLDGGGARTVGSTVESTCHAACTQVGRCKACSHHYWGMTGKDRHVSAFVCSFGCSLSPIPSAVSRITLSWCLHAMLL